MNRDFWLNSSVVVLGGGQFGSVLANLVAPNCKAVKLWMRNAETVRLINENHVHPHVFSGLKLHQNIKAYSELEKTFEGEIPLIVWAIPSAACREMAKRLAPFLCGHEMVLHATKGIEEGSLKTVSRMLEEELPIRRIGVISGPNLAKEIAAGQPTATEIGSPFEEVTNAGIMLLTQAHFLVFPSRDVIGMEWAGALKNILAIASGMTDELGYGWNTRAMLLSQGLAEIIRFGVYMGATAETFLGLSGMGDLLATCSSVLSRNYRVGKGLAQGKALSDVLEEIQSTAEGVKTLQIVHEYSLKRNISMPITNALHEVFEGKIAVHQMFERFMTSA